MNLNKFSLVIISTAIASLIYIIESFSQQIIYGGVTYVFCAAITLVFACSAYKYWTSTEHIISDIQTAINILTTEHLSPDTWETINEKFENIRMLAGPWKRFVRDGRVTADSWIQGEDNLVAVTYPRVYFNEDTIYLANVNDGLYSAIPGILTGAGLLFTFTGLSAGISLGSQGLASTHLNLSLLLETLTNLLNGAGQAFLTSLVGLLLSLLFVFGFKKTTQRTSCRNRKSEC